MFHACWCPVPPHPMQTPFCISKHKRVNNKSRATIGRPGPATDLPCRAALIIALHNKSKHALQIICIALSYIISADLRSTHIIARLGRAWRRTHARSLSCRAMPAMQSYFTQYFTENAVFSPRRREGCGEGGFENSNFVNGAPSFFDWMRADGAMTVRFGERQCPGCGVQSVGAQSRAAAWCSCLF